jgi:hypothetical protein
VIGLFVATVVAAWTAYRHSRDPASSQHDARAAAGALRRRAVHHAISAGNGGTIESLEAIRIDGLVVGTDGRGIGGALVGLQATSSSTIAGSLVTATATANGQFSFEALAPGSYWVLASAGELVAVPTLYTTTVPPRPLPIRVDKGGFATIVVVDEANQPIPGADLQTWNGAPISATQTDASGSVAIGPLPPLGNTVRVSAAGYAPAIRSLPLLKMRGEITIVLYRGVRVRGRVIDENRSPIPGARIFAGDRVPTLTNSRGEFEIPAVARGSHLLGVEADDHAPARKPLKVEDSALDGIEITLTDGATLSGIVLDSQRMPVPLATIVTDGAPRVMTDRAGAFELRGQARVIMSVSAETATATSSVLTLDLSENPQADVELVLDLVGTITGNVVDEHGDPLAGVAVTASPDEATTPAALRRSVRSRQVITDGEGKFVIAGLPDVPFRLVAQRRSTDRKPPSSRCPIATAGDRNVQIRLISNGQLVGRIVVEQAAAPRNISVMLGNRMGFSANPDGSFHITNAPAGTFDIVFYGPGFTVFGQRNVQIRPGATTDLGTVKPPSGRTLTGRVVNGSGTPVGAAQIDFGVLRLGAVDDDEPSSGFRLYRTVIARRDGTFTAELPPEPLTAFASDPDYGNSAFMEIPGSTAAPPFVTFVLPEPPDDR